ncbi:MAG: DUF58 domain-containing protein [Pyrinomonadaceae bacterium]|nr:DUF58 domain-containing protein [Pyrinomonadaceae bacterium]
MFPPSRIIRVWIRRVSNLLLIAGGVGAAFATLFARQAGDWELARMAALLSLVCVILSGVFVLPSLVSAARRDGSLFDFAARPTMGGFVYLIVLFFVTYAAWSTGNNLLFLIFSVMLSALFVTLAAGRASLRDLAVGVRFPDHIFANEAVPVIVSLHNRKRWLPALSALVKARHRALQNKSDAKEANAGTLQVPLVYFVYLSPRTRVEQRGEIVFPRRGQTSIVNFDLVTRFPLNLFRLRRRFYARDINLIVFPKPQALSEELQLPPSAHGQIASLRRGAGHDLHSLRRYRPQDDLRHIDWKATARTRQLTVREWMAEMEPRVHIQLQTTIGQEPDAPERFERGVTLAASLVQHYTREGANVRLTIGDASGDYGMDRAHFYDCLRRLALVAPMQMVTPSNEDVFVSNAQGTASNSFHAGDDHTILITASAPDSIPADARHGLQIIHV